MTEWRRVNPATEDNVELEVADKYRLRQGETRAYGPNVIHSTAHPEKAWVIRVTGTDLDSIPRYHFRPQRDRILEKT
jgi:quercetin dioxygenase-like cupin family protein